MTDLAGNHPDMAAQMQQGVANDAQTTIDSWEAAKFERLLTQGLTEITQSDGVNVIANTSIDKLFSMLSEMDAAKASYKKDIQNIADEITNNESKTISGVNAENKPISLADKLSIVNGQQLKMYEVLGNHSDALVNIGWIKDIASSSVSTIKGTINQN